MAAVQMEDIDRSMNLSRGLYRSSSPATARLEKRIKELEDLLDEERALRVKTERDLGELNAECDVLTANYQDASDQVTQHVENSRRREAEFTRMRREFDEFKEAHEETLNNLRRRQQTTLAELTTEMEGLQRAKTKAEKDRSEMSRQLEVAFTEAENANKAKATVLAKQESLEAQVVRLRSNYEDCQKRISELNSQNAQLIAETAEYARTVEKLNASITTSQRAQLNAESLLSDQKRILEEEVKMRTIAQNRLNSMMQELEMTTQRADEEADSATKLQAQVSRLTSELAQLRTKHEREVNEKGEELEETRRRLNSRITELTESQELEHSRVISLERAKNQLAGQIQELQSQLDTLYAQCAEQAQDLKSVETERNELQQLLDESQNDESTLRAKSGLLQRELTQIKSAKSEMEERMLAMEKEARLNAEKLRDSKERLSTMSRQITDLESSRTRLEAERDHLDSALKDTEDALHEIETKYQTVHSALVNLRSEVERQSRDKEEELEALRRSSQRNIDNLKAALEGTEAKYQSEIERIKKKMDTTVASFEEQLEETKRGRTEAEQAAHEAEEHASRLEYEIEQSNSLLAETSAALQMSENRRATLADEVDTLRNQLELIERLKRKCEEDAAENVSRIGDLNSQISNFTNERRKLEGQLSVLQGDMDDAVGAKEVADERSERLQAEVNRLVQELQTEQESARRSDTARRHLEAELKDANSKLLELRHTVDSAEREVDEVKNMADAKLREMQLALDEESKKTRDSQVQLRKCERSLKESMQAEEDARRTINELRELTERTQVKLRQTRRQLEEAESSAQSAMNKYRKAQQQLDDAHLRAQMAERRLGIGQNDETMSSYGPLNRNRTSGGYNPRTRASSIAREGSVYSTLSEAPQSTWKPRFSAGSVKFSRRTDSSNYPRDMGSSLSLLDLPPAETNGHNGQF